MRPAADTVQGDYTLSYHFFGIKDYRNHFELFVDTDGISDLATWQHYPRAAGAKLDRRWRFRQAAPHRRIYLEFSGPVSNNRGRLRILRRGRIHDRRKQAARNSILVTL
ncbi:MAG: hypothetical protein ACOY5B_04250 [Spirochaetota bacterium]